VDEVVENLDMYLNYGPCIYYALSLPTEVSSQGHEFDYLNYLKSVHNEDGSCVVVPTTGSVMSAAHER